MTSSTQSQFKLRDLARNTPMSHGLWWIISMKSQLNRQLVTICLGMFARPTKGPIRARIVQVQQIRE
jgi:hypothetical protein